MKKYCYLAMYWIAYIIKMTFVAAGSTAIATLISDGALLGWNYVLLLLLVWVLYAFASIIYFISDHLIESYPKKQVEEDEED